MTDHLTPEPKYPVPLKTAARWANVKSNWLREQAEAGALPGLRAGDDWLFDVRTLREVLRQMVLDQGGGFPCRNHRDRARALEDRVEADMGEMRDASTSEGGAA